jgi:hypothetical protein
MIDPLPSLQEARLARRLLFRLSELPPLGPEDRPVDAFTQAGLVASLGATQGAIARILVRLDAAGVLLVDRQRVSGRVRSTKIYRLSSRGEMLVRELSGKAKSLPIDS